MSTTRKLPDADSQASGMQAEHERYASSIGYWIAREEWAKLGKEVQTDARVHRETGVFPPGADRRRSLLTALGRRLDRGAR